MSKKLHIVRTYHPNILDSLLATQKDPTEKSVEFDWQPWGYESHEFDHIYTTTEEDPAVGVVVVESCEGALVAATSLLGLLDGEEFTEPTYELVEEQ